MLKKFLALFTALTMLMSVCTINSFAYGDKLPGYATEVVYGEWTDCSKEPEKNTINYKDTYPNDDVKKIGTDNGYLEVPCGSDWFVNNAGNPSDDGFGTYLYQADIKFNRLPDISRGIGAVKYEVGGETITLGELIKVKYNSYISCNVDGTQINTDVKFEEGKWYTLKFVYTLEEGATYKSIILVDRDATPQVTYTLLDNHKLNIVMDNLVYVNWAIGTAYNYYYNTTYNTHNDKDSWPSSTERNILYNIGNFGAYKLVKAIPSVSLIRIDAGENESFAGDVVTLNTETEFCDGCDIKLYNNGVDVTDSYVADIGYKTALNYGSNVFVAKAVNENGEVVASSEYLTVNTKVLEPAETTTATNNGFCVDYETADSIVNDKGAYWYNYGAVNLTAAIKSGDNGEGGFWIGNGDNSNIAKNGVGSAHVALSGNKYTSGDKEIELKRDIQFWHINRNNAKIAPNDIFVWSAYVKNTGLFNKDTYIPLAVKDANGKTVCGMAAGENGYYLQVFAEGVADLPTYRNYEVYAQTDLGKDADWHEYAIKYQSAENKAWFYVDGVCIGIVDKEGTGPVISGGAAGLSQFPVEFPADTNDANKVIYAIDDPKAQAYSIAEVSDFVDATASIDGVEINSDTDVTSVNDITVYADMKLVGAASTDATVCLVAIDKTNKKLRAVKLQNVSFDENGCANIKNISFGSDALGDLTNCSVRLFVWNSNQAPVSVPCNIMG